MKKFEISKNVTSSKKKEMQDQSFKLLDSHQKKIRRMQEKPGINAEGLQMDEYKNCVKMLLESLDHIDISKNDSKQQIDNIEAEFNLESKQFESALPIYSKKSEILRTIHQNPVTILTADTGSGKSTQVVQYLHQKYTKEMIMCTQPRKFAAISLAKRVSEEMDSEVGGVIGYCVGTQVKKSKKTYILFMTDQILLNEVLNDPLLSQYKYIIVDEAHERSISTDLLLSMIKQALMKRPELRLIITSATIDPKIYQKYFQNISASIHVPGRSYPVEQIYEKVAIGMNYFKISVDKVKHIHKYEKEGGILVFLTTPAETEKAQSCIKADTLGVHCLVLHGRLAPEEQQLVFDLTPKDSRKVVFATNSAETSITIPNIRYVIDSGMIKEKHYDKEKNMSLLRVAPVSKSSAIQRMGRAGRTQEGKCFRLYTVGEYHKMTDGILPEILRENPSLALLKLYHLRIENPLNYDFVQPPLMASLESAKTELHDLQALQDNKLTKHGKIMATLALEPKLGKFVSLAIDKDISFDAMVIAAVSSVGESVFFHAGTEGDKQSVDRLKAKFCNKRGDAFTILSIYKEWNQIEEDQKYKWCVDNSINAKTLWFARDLIKEMKLNVEELLGIKIDEKLSDIDTITDEIPTLLSMCFSKNLAYFSGHERGGYYRPGWKSNRFHLHPSSALSYLSMTPKWLIFGEVLTTSRAYLINTTVLPNDIGENLLKINFDSIDLVKTWVVGKATSKILEFGKRNCAQEKRMQDLICPDIYIDYDFNKGEVSLHTTLKYEEKAIAMLDKCIQKEKVWFDRKVWNVPLSDGNSTSIVLQRGGDCLEVLWEGDFNEVFISNVEQEVSKEEMEKMFEQFGEISEINKFPSKYTWGKIQFIKSASALNALGSYQQVNNELLNKIIVRKPNQQIKPNQHIVKASWTRRPAKGTYAFIKIEDPAVFKEFADTHRKVGDLLFNFKTSTQPNSLKVNWIDVDINSEEKLIFDIQNQFPHVEISKCVIPRKNKSVESSDNISSMSRELALKIKTHLGEENINKPRSVKVEMNPINFKDVNYTARIIFNNPKDCSDIANSNIIIAGANIQFNHELGSSAVTNIFQTAIQTKMSGKYVTPSRIRDKQPLIINLYDLPNGFIKNLIKRYGVFFEELYKETGASNININFLRHTLELSGSNDALIKSKNIFKDFAIKHQRRNDDTAQNSKCPICFDILETTSYQLEVCTHSYCKECIEAMCQHAASKKDLPLKCAAKGCDKFISIQDIFEITKFKDLVPAAVELFVAKNKDKYKYCLTPNCLNIYSVSEVRDPKPFDCAVCQLLICIYCNVKYHNNLPCINASESDKPIKKWLSEGNKDRGTCPNCSTPIEKLDGCNHIICVICKIHICWKCKELTFDSESECYNHMKRCGNL